MKKKFTLEGLDCADCAAKIEHAVNKLDGVKEATVNFMTQKLVIEGEDEKMPTIMQEAEKIVKKIEPGTVMKKA
ncbi:cation transport ATPase [Anaerosolibacter carboniphilus]|uniref:Cation transport ATPase n=1 Tax=Anaerosolibacter carboniphilus TaxID=1417629 RepID=A0A841KRG7_9FIRM|nr:cation transporter [Anaerosolibacter carboniphilus]MBB6214670.1 cation transport ATPase [Anaerosolibacter carboniphilus]